MPFNNGIRFISLTALRSLICIVTEAQVKKRTVHRHKTDSAAMELNSRISDSILPEAEIKGLSFSECQIPVV
jgi:hypothetical protein